MNLLFQFEMRFLGILFCSILILNSAHLSAQKKGNAQNYPKNVGIKITQSEFDKIVKQDFIKMKRNEFVKINELIKLIRIYNTITFTDDLAERNLQDKAFVDLFEADGKYENLFVIKLHARRSVGFGFYSKKYKIYLGGLPDKKSKFKLI